jgi:L-asparaginase
MKTTHFRGLLVAALMTPAALSAQAGRPKIAVIGTGGTISGHAEERSALQTYRAGTYPIQVMVDYLKPSLNEIADVTTTQFGNQGSGGYRIDQYFELTKAIDKAAETADGVVVTTGTGTQDEFVYWSEVSVHTQKPVVFVGAMRPWDVIGSEAPANLLNAIVVAASGETRCFGSVNMLNDEIHAARESWKTDNERLSTFIDRETGVLGFVDERNVRTWRAPPRWQFCSDPAKWQWPIDIGKWQDQAHPPRVEMLMGYQGARMDEAIKADADAGVKGLVIAGGGGTPAAVKYAEDKGVIIVRTERFRSGPENWMPQKARLLLIASIATGGTKQQILDRYNYVRSLEYNDTKTFPGAPRPMATQAQGDRE